MVDLKATFVYNYDKNLSMTLKLAPSAQHDEPFTERYGRILLRTVVKNEGDWTYQSSSQ